MVVWNSMLLKIIIILLGVEKQHVRFIQPFRVGVKMYF
jgi:hypothetical protein